jgi:predicted transcriptional regulator of viral defense system
MSYRDPHQSLRALHAIAVGQGGYFTAKQAAEAGYGYTHLTYHLKAGNFERADHGLYRIVTIPPAEHDDLIRLSLWSRNRGDVPQAVISHETALSLHQLSDVLPRRVHLSVPRTFRKEPPSHCVLHRATLSRGDAEQREGFFLTTPLRTLLDVAGAKTVTDEQLSRAVDDALERGLVRKLKLEAAVRNTPGAARLLGPLASSAIG